MKNVTIKNKQGQVISDLNLYEDPSDFINHIVSTNYWGKPEREVREKVWVEENVSTNPDENADGSFGYDFYPDEKYDDVDIIEKKMDVSVEDKMRAIEIIALCESGQITIEEANKTKFTPIPWVKLKAEYSIEITDVTDEVNKKTRIEELKGFLQESDFRMTYDYLEEMTLTDQQLWKNQRKAWRDELRGLLV